VEPYWSDGERTIYEGDAWALAEMLPPASVDCLITSPPYWSLRDYGVEGQFGLERHPQEWVDKLVDLFVRLRPALKKTATVFVNLGDSYFSSPAKGARGPQAKNPKAVCGRKCLSPIAETAWLRPKQLLLLPSRFAIAMQEAGFLLRNDMIWRKTNPLSSSVRDRLSCTYEHIFFFAVAEQYYFDLFAVREPLAESSIAQISQANFWEQTGGEKDYGHGINPSQSARKALVNLAKRCGRNSRICRDRDPAHSEEPKRTPDEEKACHPAGKNPGDVREWARQPFPGPHFSVFPSALPEWCLRAGCPREVCVECGKPKVRRVERRAGFTDGRCNACGRPRAQHVQSAKSGLAPQEWSKGSASMLEDGAVPCGLSGDLGFAPTCSCGTAFQPGLVLDPFAGSGTTLAVAKEKGLRAIGFELSPDYCAMAAKRINDAQSPLPMMVEAAGA